MTMSVQFVSFYLAHFEKNIKILFQKYFEENYFLFVIFEFFCTFQNRVEQTLNIVFGPVCDRKICIKLPGFNAGQNRFI